MTRGNVAPCKLVSVLKQAYVIQLEAWQSDVKRKNAFYFGKSRVLSMPALTDGGDIWAGYFQAVCYAEGYQTISGPLTGMFYDQTYITSTQKAGGPLASTDS